jgi:hypothetical protein
MPIQISVDVSSVSTILADSHTLEILNYIARSYEAGEANGTSVPISKTSLTRRQYYRRLNIMAKMGLVLRSSNGKYRITLFGRLLHAQIVSIKKLVDHYWKIRAIDSIKEATVKEADSEHQFIGLVNNLIGDDYVKALVLSSYPLGMEKADQIAATN